MKLRIHAVLTMSKHSIGEGSNRGRAEKLGFDRAEMDWWRCLWEGEKGAPRIVRFATRALLPPLPDPALASRWGLCARNLCIGDLEVVKITKFERVWSYRSSKQESKGAALYKPIEIPEGFFVLGHYGQLNDRLLHGFVLVARETFSSKEVDLPALQRPQDYTLVWSSNDLQEDNYGGESGYFGSLVLKKAIKPFVFFKNGATLHKKGEDTKGEAIERDGTNLPRGGDNDGEYWIDLPNDDRSTYLKLETSKVRSFMFMLSPL
uniref:Uncharacterized protein n=1 Tax=Ananas comosus var. bracteatus TaxID=296719 RepID=A0A6V7QCL5_ANACO|nr:unnamed protein product [Ananas comosus var. bracteatus]